ncbi:hypothetical protein Tco_1108936 [Tanacetum coccineum]
MPSWSQSLRMKMLWTKELLKISRKENQMMLIRMKALPLDQTEGTSKSQPKSTSKSAQAEETVFEAGDTQEPHNQGSTQCKEYLFDLSKPLPLIMERGRQVVPADFFFNNDLEYQMGGSSSKKYMTSTTKIKTAKYDIPAIEDWLTPPAVVLSPTGKVDLDLFKLAIVFQKAKQIQDFGPTSGIRASRGTLTSYHEDASDIGTATNKPKHQQQQLIPTTTTILNIKLLILKKEEYDIWAMEMEHYLEYIDNDVWKVIQNGNSKKRISTGKYDVVRILPPVSAAEIHAVEKERKAKTIILMAIPKEHLRRFHGMSDAKEIWEAIRTRFGGNANSKKIQKAILKQQFKRDSFYQDQGAGKKEQKQNCLLTMDDGVVNWGEHIVEEEESNHALMAINSNNEVIKKLQILAYSQAVKKREAQLVTYKKLTNFSLNEKLTFQANEIYEKDEKLKKYRRIGMKAVLGGKPVWTNTDRINHANQFVPRPVQLNAGRPNINSVRHNINTGRTNINYVRPNINTGRTNINSVRPKLILSSGKNVNSVKSNVNIGRTNVNLVRPRVNTGSSNVNTIRSRQPVPTKTSNSFSPKRPQGSQLTLLSWLRLAIPGTTVLHWLVQKQTVFELTIPEQTATGKGISNPFMAGSLPKTTKPTYVAV